MCVYLRFPLSQAKHCYPSVQSTQTDRENPTVSPSSNKSQISVTTIIQEPDLDLDTSCTSPKCSHEKARISVCTQWKEEGRERGQPALPTQLTHISHPAAADIKGLNHPKQNLDNRHSHARLCWLGFDYIYFLKRGVENLKDQGKEFKTRTPFYFLPFFFLLSKIK